MTNDLDAQLNAEQQAARGRYWRAVDDASHSRAVDLPDLRGDLTLVGASTAAFQRDVAAVRSVRHTRADAGRGAEADGGELARLQGDQQAADAEVIAMRESLRLAEERLSAANVLIAATADARDARHRQRLRAAEQANETAAELRKRGYAGDLGATPAPRKMVRVRAHAECFVDNVLRQRGDVFDLPEDQVGGVALPVEVPLSESTEPVAAGGGVAAPPWTTEGFKRRHLGGA